MNQIVKYHNDVNTVSLREFNATELDIFIAILSCLRNIGTEEVTFTFDEIKKLIQWKPKDHNRFLLLLKNTYNKLLHTIIEIGNNKEWTSFVLFTKYTVSDSKSTVVIAVNKEFQYTLNMLTSNFTRFELEEFISLKSTYAKEFYRRMKQFRNTGVWRVSLDEFKRVMSVPEKYKMDTIDKYILTPIITELGEKYSLEIIKLYTKGGRGRPSVCGFEFTFLKDSELANNTEAETITLSAEAKTQEKPEESVSQPQMRKQRSFHESYYLTRTMRVPDKKFSQVNCLKIIDIERDPESGKISVEVENRDDGHINTMHFDNLEIWESFFYKHLV